MSRGATLSYPLLETLLITQRALTIVLSGYNAFYFATYQSPRGRRRVGAIVLVAVNLALGGESAAFGFLAQAVAVSGALTLGSQLVAASLSLAAVAAMAVLILRQRTAKR